MLDPSQEISGLSVLQEQSVTTITVDTDGVSGDYSSLSAALAAITFDDDYTITCAASTGEADTTGVVLPNTGSYTLTITPASGQRHNGVWDDSLYRLEPTWAPISWGGGHGQTQNYRIVGMQLRRTTTNSNYQTTINGGDHRSGTVVFDSCLIRGPNNTSYRSRMIDLEGDYRFSGDLIFLNNVIYDVGGTSHSASSVFSIGMGAPYTGLYNNTIIGGNVLCYFLTTENYVLQANNNIITAGSGGQGVGVITGDHNTFTGDFDFGGLNDISNATVNFTDANADDYSLTDDNNDVLGNAGDLSADEEYAFNYDILDTSRPQGTDWDRGAFEYASAPENLDELTADSLLLGAPVLDQPSIAQNHSITATDVVTGAVALTEPLLGQEHALTGTDLTSETPTLDTPSLTQLHALAAQGLAVGAAELEQATVRQLHQLSADDLETGATVLGTPTLTDVATGSLVALNIETSPVALGDPEISQVHVLNAVPLEVGPVDISLADISVTALLQAQSLQSGTVEIGTPGISSASILTAISIETAAPVLGISTLTQLHVLTAGSIETVAPQLGSPIEGLEGIIATVRISPIQIVVNVPITVGVA